MRVLECVCGECLRSESDDELLGRLREHVGRRHPELRFGEERLWAVVANAAYQVERTHNVRQCFGWTVGTRVDRKGTETVPAGAGSASMAGVG